MYSNDGIPRVLSRLCIRQENLLKGKFTTNENALLGLTLSPSKSTIDSVPYLIATDFESAVTSVLEFSDYIVINLTERDKSKRAAIMGLRQKDELTRLVRKVRRRIAIDLGKIAALEYSKLQNEQSSTPEIVDVYEQVRKVMIRNSLMSKNTVPLVLLKIDSYLTEQEYKDIAEVMIAENVDGVIIGSTVPVNVGIKDKSKRKYTSEVALGGAGGEITQPFATYALKTMYGYTQGKKLLISSGGIFTGQDMYDRMTNGANCVQIYSALAFHGPYVVKQILEEFSDILKRNGETAQSIIGKGLKSN